MELPRAIMARAIWPISAAILSPQIQFPDSPNSPSSPKSWRVPNTPPNTAFRNASPVIPQLFCASSYLRHSFEQIKRHRLQAVLYTTSTVHSRSHITFSVRAFLCRIFFVSERLFCIGASFLYRRVFFVSECLVSGHFVNLLQNTTTADGPLDCTTVAE